MKTCAGCGSSFDPASYPNSHRQKYCSSSCRYHATFLRNRAIKVEQSKVWKDANREKVNESARESRRAKRLDPELAAKVREKDREWGRTEAGRASVKASFKRWYEKTSTRPKRPVLTPEEKAARRRLWKKGHHRRRRERSRSVSSVVVSSTMCCVCGLDLVPDPYPHPLSTTDGHEPPLSRARPGEVVVVRPEHHSCNMWKRDRLDSELLECFVIMGV